MSPRYGVARAELISALQHLGQIVAWEREQHSELGPATPALHAFLRGRHQLIDELPRGGVIQRGWCLGQEVFCIPGQKRFMADFYRNSILHLITDMSLLSILDLLNLPLTSAAVAPLYRILAHDLLLPDEAQFRSSFDERVQRLCQRGVLGERDGNLRFVNRDFGTFIPGALLSTLQTYLWIYYNLGLLSSADRHDETAHHEISATRFIKKLQGEFKTASYLGLVSRTEAASHSALSSAVESLVQRGILSFNENRTNGRAPLADMRAEAEILRRANDAILHWFAATVAPSAAPAITGAETRSEAGAKS